MNQNLRLLVASAISVLVIVLWDMYIVKPMMEYDEQSDSPQVQVQKIEEEQIKEDKSSLISREMNLGFRKSFENEKVSGSVNLKGLRIDDLRLKKYKESLDDESKNIELLSPSKAELPYFIDMGWLFVSGSKVELPNSKTLWSYNNGVYSWINSSGIKFTTSIKLDENYMFDVNMKVENLPEGVKLSPYALINRVPFVEENKNMLIHEGAISVANKKLDEVEFEKLAENKEIEIQNPEWIGFSDKYWLTAIIPAKKGEVKSTFNHILVRKEDRYQGSIVAKELPNENGNISYSFKIFSGAKELEVLDAYEDTFDITLFDRAVDFGYLYFITKPIFILLHWFYNLLGNFGFAILGLTVFIKLLLFPLAHKGYKGMNRLKDLQPKMTELKNKYKDDPEGFRKAMIDLYKKEKVNPMGGCLPLLLQIPVFFALYKVLYVSIEMRHAPFFGWIKDLSAPDPTSIVNLFGLIPIELPQFLMIGIFPILMALTMYIQQRLNPEPTDPVQAKVMRLMPLMFLFMFASFPIGLVIYWSWSNFLSILQQIYIKKLSGEKVIIHSRKSKKS